MLPYVFELPGDAAALFCIFVSYDLGPSAVFLRVLRFPGPFRHDFICFWAPRGLQPRLYVFFALQIPSAALSRVFEFPRSFQLRLHVFGAFHSSSSAFSNVLGGS